ncbi:MAG: hypothetical protein ACOYOE_11030 [Chlorobium sp.]
MLKIFALLFVFLSFFPATHFAQSKDINIESLSNGAQVDAEITLSGTVNNAREVWIIVHPRETSDYWVQSTVTVRDERWNGRIAIGRASVIDSGKHFEIMAVADPEQPLAEAQVYKEWPSARWKSPIVSITRK